MLPLRLISGLALAAVASALQAQDSFTCDSPIYCDGDILKTVQLARIFPDSKTFVDMVRIDMFVLIKLFNLTFPHIFSPLQSQKPKSSMRLKFWV